MFSPRARLLLTAAGCVALVGWTAPQGATSPAPASAAGAVTQVQPAGVMDRPAPLAPVAPAAGGALPGATGLPALMAPVPVPDSVGPSSRWWRVAGPGAGLGLVAQAPTGLLADGTTSSAPAGSTTPSTVAPVSTARPAARTPVRQVAPAAVRAQSCRTGRIVLTFDDGPHPERTAELVRWLTRRDIPAAFFLVGSRVHTAPGLVRALSANPRLFTVANHTWKHPDLRRRDTLTVRRSLRWTRTAVQRAGGRPSALMRPPYGATNPRVLAAIRAEGLVPVLWNVDSEDWKGGNRKVLAHRILAQLRPGRANVVLQHDGINNSYESVRAVPIVVREATRRGYCFVGLDGQGHPGMLLQPPAATPPATQP